MTLPHMTHFPLLLSVVFIRKQQVQLDAFTKMNKHYAKRTSGCNAVYQGIDIEVCVLCAHRVPIERGGGKTS